MRKVSLSEKHLKLVLAVLGIFVVCLVVVIAVVNINKPNITFYNSNDVGVDCSRIERLEDVYDVAGCMKFEYENGDKELAIDEYRKAIDEAYDAGDEEKIVILSALFAYTYLDDGKCDEAFAVLENDDRAPKLSAEARLGFYNNLIDIARSCNDSERAALYEEYADRVWKSDELEISDLESEENQDEDEEVYESND